jgi:hypothetical protein
MAIFSSGCNGIASDKTIKFEGNNLTILAGGASLYNSNGLRFWYDQVDNWVTTNFEILPTEIKTFTHDFDFLYILMEKPKTTITTLSCVIRLYNGLTLLNTFTIADLLLINSLDNYTSIQIENTSTNTVLPFKVNLLIAKTKL